MSIQNFNITIIVLLILAGVSISLVVGDNGVLTQASSASEKTDVAKAQEAVEQAISSMQGAFTEVWAKDNSKVFMNFIGNTDSDTNVDGTWATHLKGYTVTGFPTTTDVAKDASKAGYITVNNQKYYFQVTGTSNGLGATIKWATNNPVTGTATPTY